MTRCDYIICVYICCFVLQVAKLSCRYLKNFIVIVQSSPFMTPYLLSKIMASPISTSPTASHFPLERKLKKPLMEKRRRARMNECLDQLKHLLLHISPNHRTKLEKADILEMTVAYLSQVHHSSSPSTSYDNCAIYHQSYAEGFTVAASACLAYLQHALPAGEFAPHAHQFRLGLMHHLQAVMSTHAKSYEDSGPISPKQSMPNIVQPCLAVPPLAACNNPLSNYPPSNIHHVGYPSCSPYVENPSILLGNCNPLISSGTILPNATFIPKASIPTTVAVVAAQTALTGSCSNCQMKQNKQSGPVSENLMKNVGSKDELEMMKKTRNIKLWRPF